MQRARNHARFTTVLLISLACQAEGSPPAPKSQSSEDPKSSLDATLINLVIKDFATQPIWPNDPGAKKRLIVVDLETDGPSGMLSDDQILSDTRKEGWQLNSELLSNLRLRNSDKKPLRGISVGRNVVNENLSKLPNGLDWPTSLEKKHPNAKAWVNFWLPGYSKDGTRAVVRFWFGETPHGAIGTYLLIKTKTGHWRVAGSTFSYYL